MVWLREILSIMLLVDPAGFQTGHLPGRDVHAIAPTATHHAAPARGLNRRETVNAGGYAWTFFAPSECTRLALRHRPQVRFDACSPHASEAAGQNRYLLRLVKSVLRLVTDYAYGAARAAYGVPAKIVTIGIRG